jgi:drug/metabolite transporter (DMT)-like permease
MTATATAQPSSPASRALSRPAAYAMLTALVVIWGLNWPIMKLVVHAMPPLWFVVTRLTVGAACLFAFLLVTGRLAKPTRADWPVVISVSVFQMWLFIGLSTIGLQFIPAGRSAILAYTMPLWVFPAAVLFFGEKLTRWKVIGMVLGLAGLIVLLNPASIDWSDRNVLLGNFLLLVAAAMWAVAILHTRRHRWNLSPLQLAPFQMALLIVPACFVAWAMEGPFRGEWSWGLLAMLLYNGPLATAFAFWAAVSIQRALPSTTVSLSYLAVPAWGLAASTLWLSEALPASLVLGGLLILLGVAAIAIADTRHG